MKRTLLTLIALLMLVSMNTDAQILPVPQRMNYQGRLAKPDGTPVADGNYSIRFSLWDALNGGNMKWSQTSTVSVQKGVFTTLLDTSTGAADKFNGNLWLEIKVGSDPPLSPRQVVGSVAYAMKADLALGVKDGSITSASIADGTLSAADFAPNLFNPIAWLLTGNSGTDFRLHFVGTTDNQPLVLRANKRRGMLYRYVENTATAGSEYRGINVLGGADINSIASGIVGATIAGGGQDRFTGTDYPNQVTADFGTIGGGYSNTAGNQATVAGGQGNTASGGAASIGGGDNNTASHNNATIGGGSNNIATQAYATVSGGSHNTATSLHASIAGGLDNIASGVASSVPGGAHNTAAGILSFAAGRRAKANHDGAFVWADNTDADFASTGINQFLVRATGGVGIGWNAPTAQLHILGLSTTDGTLKLQSPKGVNASHAHYGANGDWYIRSAAGGGKVILQDMEGNVGIGTSNPGAKLHVNGTTRVKVLEITGGADLAERFEVQGKIESGMVVEIDPDHEGKLRVSAGAFNKRVVGVISGAKQLNAGVVLTDPNDKAQNSLPVAMSGRVWVWCDTIERAIEPGDFLTTAQRPGHAMPVADLVKAQGAILGKAMTRLEQGKTGLVLILVNLQ